MNTSQTVESQQGTWGVGNHLQITTEFPLPMFHLVPTITFKERFITLALKKKNKWCLIMGEGTIVPISITLQPEQSSPIMESSVTERSR